MYTHFMTHNIIADCSHFLLRLGPFVAFSQSEKEPHTIRFYEQFQIIPVYCVRIIIVLMTHPAHCTIQSDCIT